MSFTIWRHPKPRDAQGRCIGGRTDLAVDPRKAKRLAHRIRQHARRLGLPREVVTSPLRRAADVGRCLRRWGFVWRVDPLLAEHDFGAWDGQHWQQITQPEFERWMADFAGFEFDGGECVADLVLRAKAWRPPCGLVVGHAGWIAARSLATPLDAKTWPKPLGYGRSTQAPSD